MASRAEIMLTDSPRRQRACEQKGRSDKGEWIGRGNKPCGQNEFENAAETHVARARVGAPVAHARDERRVARVRHHRVVLAVRAEEAERVVGRALRANGKQPVS